MPQRTETTQLTNVQVTQTATTTNLPVANLGGEFDAFQSLAATLIAVPKSEIDEQREA